MISEPQPSFVLFCVVVVVVFSTLNTALVEQIFPYQSPSAQPAASAATSPTASLSAATAAAATGVPAAAAAALSAAAAAAAALLLLPEASRR